MRPLHLDVHHTIVSVHLCVHRWHTCAAPYQPAYLLLDTSSSNLLVVVVGLGLGHNLDGIRLHAVAAVRCHPSGGVHSRKVAPLLRIVVSWTGPR